MGVEAFPAATGTLPDRAMANAVTSFATLLAGVVTLPPCSFAAGPRFLISLGEIALG
jgi:hypothetical protein